MAVPRVCHSVEITGPALSFLYFVATTESFSNAGLLLGTTNESQTRLISDTDEGDVKEEIVSRITGVVPWSKETAKTLLDCTGMLNNTFRNSLDSVIKKRNGTEVVGWFSCRRNSQAKPSFRETVLHTLFGKEVGKGHGGRFIFALVQDAFSLTNMTYDSHATFFELKDGTSKWTSLEGSIMNWSQKSYGSNKSPYQLLPSHEPQLLETFAAKAKSLGLEDTELVEHIFINANDHVIESVKRIAKLSADVAEMEAKISALKENSKTVPQDFEEDGNK